MRDLGILPMEIFRVSSTIGDAQYNSIKHNGGYESKAVLPISGLYTGNLKNYDVKFIFLSLIYYC
jgi:hypothetical protein